MLLHWGAWSRPAKVLWGPQISVYFSPLPQTSNDNIFAVGDVCSPYQFTHASDFMARMVVRNALFFGSDKFSSLLIPWCTYTSPGKTDQEDAPTSRLS
jgi:hypothetical protein